MTDLKTLPSKRRLLPRIATALLSIVIIGVIVWIVRIYYLLETEIYTDDAQVEQYINPVNTRITGYLREIRFTDHQRVHKGDTLVTIDDREYRIAVEQARAAWLAARASKDVSASSVSTVHSNLQIIDANIRSLDARIWNAQQNMERFGHLLNDDAATQQQYDQVKTDYTALVEQKEALLRQRATTNLSTAETSKRIPVNEADIQQAHATLDLARLNLSYTIITAPYDGVTGRRNIQEGQAVSAGQNLLSFVRSDSKWITANFKETQVTRFHIGEKMSLTIDGVPGVQFEGQIVAISEATGSKYSAIPVDNSTGNFVKVRQRVPVRIEFTAVNNKDDLQRLVAGMNVEVRIARK